MWQRIRGGRAARRWAGVGKTRLVEEAGVRGSEIGIGDPRDLHRRHPMIEATEMTDDEKGRINTRTDGGRVSETILEHGDRHHSYRVDESPSALDSFVATIRVRDEEGSSCVVQWDASFRSDGSDAEAAQLVRGFLQAGLDAL